MKVNVFILLCLIKVLSFAQDIHFSQFNDLPLTLNPALSGNMDGTVRTGTIYRNQWNSVSVPFESYGLYADFKSVPKFLKNEYIGLGIQILNDNSGSGGLNENVLSLCGSFHHFLSDKQNQLITAGLSFGAFQKSIDLSKLNFQNQFQFETANFGNISSNEVLENNSLAKLDLGLGAAWTYFSEYGYQIITGISLMHLNKPNTSFYGNNDPLARKINIHASGIYPINDRVDIDPSLLISKQNNNINTVIGADLIYNLGRKTIEKIDLKLGLFARFGDSFNFTIGMNHDNWSIDAGYDLNVSSLVPASQSRGAFEISISFVNRMFNGSKNMRYIIPGNRLL